MSHHTTPDKIKRQTAANEIQELCEDEFERKVIVLSLTDNSLSLSNQKRILSMFGKRSSELSEQALLKIYQHTNTISKRKALGASLLKRDNNCE